MIFIQSHNMNNFCFINFIKTMITRKAITPIFKSTFHPYFLSATISYRKMSNEAMETDSLGLKTINEGQAKVLLTSDHVFYNPVQEFNRDLSIAVLRTFIEDYQQIEEDKQLKIDNRRKLDVRTNNTFQDKKNEITVLEALSATGLRSIRYAKEVPGVNRIIANDISAKAVESIGANIELNGVKHLVVTSHDDASMVMYKNRKHCDRFTAVDLDPYGCPSIFLDGAVQCIKDGGLLLVTATDMAVLAGNSPETCYSKYGAISLRSKACHEQALRILLQCIESHANRYGRYIVPLLSVSADFYIRVFVKIFTGPIHCKKSTSKLSMVYQCVGCDMFTLQPLGTFKPNPGTNDPNRTKACLPHAPPISTLCVNCNQRHHIGGPVWSGLLHDISFVERVLTIVDRENEKFSTAKRIQGILCMVREELHDVPLYYSMDKLSSCLHLESMPMLVMRSALMNGGFRVSYSHASKTSIKTDAPPRFIWDILRSWEKEHPVKKERLEEDAVTKYILSQEITSPVDLSIRQDANPTSRKEGFLRFQFNPTAHWGPGTRASSRVGEDKISKSKKNQNKHHGQKHQYNKNIEETLDTSQEETVHSKIAKIE